MNPKCSHSHSDGALSLGEIYLSDGQLMCPHCNSAVYELYNDRRCGALFVKGYVQDEDLTGQTYLWRYPGQLLDYRMKVTIDTGVAPYSDACSMTWYWMAKNIRRSM